MIVLYLLCSCRLYVAHGTQQRLQSCIHVDHVPKAKPTMHESMFYTNLSGCLVAIALALFAGQLTEGISRSGAACGLPTSRPSEYQLPETHPGVVKLRELEASARQSRSRRYLKCMLGHREKPLRRHNVIVKEIQAASATGYSCRAPSSRVIWA